MFGLTAYGIWLFGSAWSSNVVPLNTLSALPSLLLANVTTCPVGDVSVNEMSELNVCVMATVTFTSQVVAPAPAMLMVDVAPVALLSGIGTGVLFATVTGAAFTGVVVNVVMLSDHELSVPVSPPALSTSLIVHVPFGFCP